MNKLAKKLKRKKIKLEWKVEKFRREWMGLKSNWKSLPEENKGFVKACEYSHVVIALAKLSILKNWKSVEDVFTWFAKKHLHSSFQSIVQAIDSNYRKPWYQVSLNELTRLFGKKVLFGEDLNEAIKSNLHLLEFSGFSHIEHQQEVANRLTDLLREHSKNRLLGEYEYKIKKIISKIELDIVTAN